VRTQHTVAPSWPSPVPASRFAGSVRTDSSEGCQIGLIGLADDLGVKLNGGRPGAREGPRAFREALARYGVADPHGWDWPRVFDAGDIIPAEGETEAALLETHRRVTEATNALLDAGLFPVAIGGGHDLTLPFARAAAGRKTGPLSAVYFDAHLDVRPTVGSGMAFRKLVEECGVSALSVHGLNPVANSREHVEWFLKHGGSIEPALTKPQPIGAFTRPGRVIVSFDLDVLNVAVAPGVSAVQPAGTSIAAVARLVYAAGASESVVCFDIMELCPRFDADSRTAMAAAHLFLTFLFGYARRGKGAEPAPSVSWDRP